MPSYAPEGLLSVLAKTQLEFPISESLYGRIEQIMRIAMVSEFPEDLDHPTGGVEAVAACLARGLVAGGVDLTVIRFGALNAPAHEAAVAQATSIPILRVPRYRPGTFTNWLISPFEIGRVVRKVAPDLVHVQGIPELYRGGSVPSVLTVHGMTFLDALYGRSWLSRPISMVLRMSFMESIRHYRDVIRISPYVGRELGERAGTRYFDIPNPVEDRFFEIDRAPEPDTILYVGTLSRLKNIVGLLEGVACARSRIPGIRVRLAGPWYGDYEPAVRETIRKRDLEGAVSFLGSLTREELAVELARCSCTVLASFQETAPVAIEEAMAAGVPVLASRVGGVEWMIGHEETGFLFDPYHPEQLGEYLVCVLSDHSLRDRLGSAARDWANRSYRREVVVERTLEVYEQAIAEHGRGRQSTAR